MKAILEDNWLFSTIFYFQAAFLLSCRITEESKRAPPAWFPLGPKWLL